MGFSWGLGTAGPPSDRPSPAARIRKGHSAWRRHRKGGGLGLRCLAGEPGLGRWPEPPVRARLKRAWPGHRRRRLVPYTPVCGWKSGRETRGWERDGVCASAEPGAGRGAGPRLPCARRRSAASPAAPPRSGCPRSPGASSAAAEREGRNSCDVLTKLKYWELWGVGDSLANPGLGSC